jgi:hypothetical protein
MSVAMLNIYFLVSIGTIIRSLNNGVENIMWSERLCQNMVALHLQMVVLGDLTTAISTPNAVYPCTIVITYGKESLELTGTFCCGSKFFMRMGFPRTVLTRAAWL